MSLRGALRDFHRPTLWLSIWGFGWLLCIVLSLIPPPPLSVQVPESDKFGHFLAYGLLSAWAVWIFASGGHRLRAAFALCALGVALEIAQGLLTPHRQLDGSDALADALGVIAGWIIAAGPARGLLQAIDRRLFAPG